MAQHLDAFIPLSRIHFSCRHDRPHGKLRIAQWMNAWLLKCLGSRVWEANESAAMSAKMSQCPTLPLMRHNVKVQTANWMANEAPIIGKHYCQTLLQTIIAKHLRYSFNFVKVLSRPSASANYNIVGNVTLALLNRNLSRISNKNMQSRHRTV